MSHMELINHVAETDLAELRRKEATYKGSWKKRGGLGAFMMIARKWDRIEGILGTSNPDILKACAADLSGADGTLLAEVRDLRRYLTLVEAEVIAQSVAPAAEIRAEELLRDAQHAAAYAVPHLDALIGGAMRAGDLEATERLHGLVNRLNSGELSLCLPELQGLLAGGQLKAESHLAVSKLISAIEATFVGSQDRML